MPCKLLAGVLLVSGTAHTHADRVELAFEKFVSKFEKVYLDDEERQARFATFKNHFAFIEAENVKGHSYTLGINAFADQEPHEFQAKRLGLSNPGPRVFKGAHLGSHKYSGAELKAEVDWVSSGAVTPVKDQGTCGSCWSFSATGAVEGAWMVATGDLVSFSEQQLIDCVHGEEDGCGGGDMDTAFEFFESVDLCTEESYPYEAKERGSCKSSCEVGVSQGGVTGFRDVPVGSVEALMEAAAQQPVSVAIQADQTSFQMYESGVLTGACGGDVDHGVLCVGYGTAADGTDYWKIKNSWGSDWGEGGFLRIQRGNHGEAGQCGILSMASYPVVSGRAPPAPAPAPAPLPPTPGSGHYGAPPCQADEVEATIADGVLLCTPYCDQNDGCPDVPSNAVVAAVPQCSLADANGNGFCGLMCAFDASCPSGARCYMSDPSSALGICGYPSESSAAATALFVKKSDKDVVI